MANRHSLECVQFGWKYGSLIKHSIVSIQVSDAVKVCVTDNQNGHMPAIVVDKMSLIDKEHITAIWHKDFVNGSLSVSHHKLNKEDTIQIREFGPQFGKVGHNRLLYESVLQWRESVGSFKKETPVKVNKLVSSHDVLDYSQLGDVGKHGHPQKSRLLIGY